MEDRTPQAHHWVLPLMVGAVLYVWASSQEPTSFYTIMTALSGIFFLWFLLNFFHQFILIIGDLWERVRLVNFKFTQNHLAETIGRMTEYQVKALRAGRGGIVEIIPTDSGPVEKVYGTEVYLYTAWYILTHSDEYHVYPINRFQSGTYHMDVMGDHSIDDYNQARNFHTWLYQNGIGTWGRGNTSMSWVDGWSPLKVMAGLGLDRETYED